MFVAAFYYPPYVATWFLAKRRPGTPTRGMDFYHDLRDWIGGYPYEYLTKEEILAQVPAEFRLIRYLPPLVPTGNHQLVFRIG
jgi:hypothetical protein